MSIFDNHDVKICHFLTKYASNIQRSQCKQNCKDQECLIKMSKKFAIWTSSHGNPKRWFYKIVMNKLRDFNVKIFHKSGQTLNGEVVDNVIEYGYMVIFPT